MEKGWLALNIVNAYIPTRLVWQPTRPGWFRLRLTPGAVPVITPKAWGRGCPEGYICKKCKITLFSYDEKDAT